MYYYIHFHIGIDERIVSPSLLVYYVGTFAIPLFFMVNGYLQLSREVNYKYSFKKIIKILVVAFFWNFAIIILRYIVEGQLDNPFSATIRSLIQKGNFSHFWFLGSLILIYLILPLLCKLFNRTNNLYKYVVAILFLLCILVNILNIYNYNIGNKIIKYILSQTFRLWTWLFYFCLGGLINKKNIFEKINKKFHFVLSVVLIIITIIYCYVLALKLYGSLSAENFYDSLVVILTTIFIFTAIKRMKLKKERILTEISSLTMGVYIVHTYVLTYTRKVIPLNGSIPLSFLTLLIVFCISIIASYIISKIQKINEFIKL